MFRLLKMRTKRRVDETPWQAARKDDVAPVNGSEMEIESEKDEMIMDMNRTTWVELTSEDVVDLRLNGERLGSTAFACFDRKLRIRRARQNTCRACNEFHQNNENAMFRKSRNASNKIQHPVTLNLDNSNDSIAVSDSTDSSSSSSFEWIDRDPCLSSGDSSDYSDGTRYHRQDSCATSAEEEHHWGSSQEGDSAAASPLAFNRIKENKRADFISNLKKLSHNCNQHASYLCPVCNVQYAPKEYFMLHLTKVHGMVSVAKNAASDSNNNKNIDGAMSSHVVEPDVSNQSSILRKRRANSIGRHISVKTHSTCESYSDVLHKCPFCEAPYLLKHLARHFEEMHADDLKLFKCGKDRLVVQSVNGKKRVLETTQAIHLAKINSQLFENECTIIEDVVDQNSYPETHKKNSYNAQETDEETDICGSFNQSMSEHAEEMHKRTSVECSITRNKTDLNCSKRESGVFIPTTDLIELPNVTKLHCPINTREYNVINPTAQMACHCLQCGLLMQLSDQAKRVFKNQQEVKYRCPRCNACNDPRVFKINETISMPSTLLVLTSKIDMEQQEKLLQIKTAADGQNNLCKQKRIKYANLCSNHSSHVSKNNLSSDGHRPESNCTFSITALVSPDQTEIPAIVGCIRCSYKLTLSRQQIHSLTVLHEIVQSRCPKCLNWNMLQVPSSDTSKPASNVHLKN